MRWGLWVISGTCRFFCHCLSCLTGNKNPLQDETFFIGPSGPLKSSSSRVHAWCFMRKEQITANYSSGLLCKGSIKVWYWWLKRLWCLSFLPATHIRYGSVEETESSVSLKDPRPEGKNTYLWFQIKTREAKLDLQIEVMLQYINYSTSINNKLQVNLISIVCEVQPLFEYSW